MLVYITCSIIEEENSAQAATFLAAHPEFELIPLSLETLLPGAGEKAHAQPASGVLLTPLRTETDGFFCASFRRRD